jgi:hypothetical protein
VFFQFTCAQDVLVNLATSLTNLVRLSISLITNEEQWVGTVYTEVLFVKVQRFWLIFLVNLILMAVLFLVSKIVKTRSSAIEAWKGSPEMLLFMGTTETFEGRNRMTDDTSRWVT